MTLTMKSATLAALAMGALAVACSSAPAGRSEIQGETSEAACSGIEPGCGPCAWDPSSPEGGYETCWACTRTYEVECYYPHQVVPATPRAYASPSAVSPWQDSTTIHYSVSVPGGCSLRGSYSAYQGSVVWINGADLVPPANGSGSVTILGVDATTEIALTFWCAGYSASASAWSTVTYAR